jgi:hypothetical protein
MYFPVASDANLSDGIGPIIVELQYTNKFPLILIFFFLYLKQFYRCGVIYYNMKTKRIITAKLTRMKDNDRSFDREFWQQAGTEAIFTAAWQMVIDAEILKGRDATQLRLQRSVETVKRLRS